MRAPDITKIKEFFVNKEGVKSLIFFLLSLIMLSIIYSVLLKPSQKYLALLTNEIKEKRAEFEEYKNPDYFMYTYDQKYEQVKDLIREFKGSVSTQGLEGKDFLDEIGRICRASGVELNNINVSGGEGKGQVYTLAFNANYEKLSNFLSLFESIFKIEMISITSGRENRKHIINVSATALKTGTAAAAACDTSKKKKKFVEIYEETYKLAKELRMKKGEEESVVKIDRDPMLYSDTIFIPQRVVKKNVQPALRIDGIIMDKTNPVVIIDGNIYKEGSVVSGFKITKINHDSVVGVWGGKTITYRQ
jgi:hypothetical protein